MAAFIQSQAPLEIQSPVGDFSRLAQSLAPEADLSAVQPVAWRAQGRLVPQRVGAPHLWLDLHASAQLPWACQRCLQPVTLPLQLERSLRFVADEATAARLDADLDDDVLALSPTFDLLELVEDELIMSAPLVPRHEVCPQPPVMSVSDPGVEDAAEAQAAGGKANPFGVLAQLKKSGGGNDGAGGDGQGS